MRTLEAFRAAQSYAETEAARLNSSDPANTPTTVPDLAPFPGAEALLDGERVLFQIEPGHGGHLFDTPMFLFLMAATTFGGSILLNSRVAPKAAGRSRFYVRLDFPREGGRRTSIQVNRIVANARPGERIHENPEDHRDHMPERLTKTSSHDLRTRADAVAAALRHYDRTPAVDPVKRAIRREDYKALLWQLLALADARWADRMVRDTVATTPWEHAGLIAG